MQKHRGSVEQELGGSLTRRNLFAAATVVVSAIGATALGATRASAGPGGTIGGGGQCYLTGTRILTPDGPRDVSQLRIGDSVVSYSGKAKPIKWIGRNRFVRKSDESWSTNVMPVKVARFALDGQTPSADLYLSAGHAIYLDGLLIQVGSLINGETIARDPAADREVLEYLQIELADHDVIFAEGAATETFLPSADRKLFDNWREYDALYGAVPIAQAKAFASETYLAGTRSQLRSRLRSAFSPWIDRRQPFDVVRDRIEQRAEVLRAAA
jgi:hypothetical protein